ncbi:MAG: carbon monoxide dehydrogenase subunit G [Betaproteobacteria bacterium]|nr:carbon monoxide dehydrogenase subunit G [Betaproteobacteria bacterium]MBV9360800.1 carbon monoxide dehydrogenase subunit G [Betaproteobacteria bacterium]
MEMTGEQLIAAPRKEVWDALNDPQMLKTCVPGCESIEPTGENEFQVLMVARVGPVSAKFKGKLTLSDIKPPESYSLSFEGQGGAAGFAKGGANVRLESVAGDKTRLAYDVKASVGGKLAQIGSRLVDAAAKKVADDFFRTFNAKVGAAQGGEDVTVLLPPSKKEAAEEEATVVMVMPKEEPPEEEHHDDDHPHPIPRDPDLPDVSPTTLMFFAGSALVIFVVALSTLLH